MANHPLRTSRKQFKFESRIQDSAKQDAIASGLRTARSEISNLRSEIAAATPAAPPRTCAASPDHTDLSDLSETSDWSAPAIPRKPSSSTSRLRLPRSRSIQTYLGLSRLKKISPRSRLNPAIQQSNYPATPVGRGSCRALIKPDSSFRLHTSYLQAVADSPRPDETPAQPTHPTIQDSSYPTIPLSTRPVSYAPAQHATAQSLRLNPGSTQPNVGLAQIYLSYGTDFLTQSDRIRPNLSQRLFRQSIRPNLTDAEMRIPSRPFMVENVDSQASWLRKQAAARLCKATQASRKISFASLACKPSFPNRQKRGDEAESSSIKHPETSIGFFCPTSFCQSPVSQHATAQHAIADCPIPANDKPGKTRKIRKIFSFRVFRDFFPLGGGKKECTFGAGRQAECLGQGTSQTYLPLCSLSYSLRRIGDSLSSFPTPHTHFAPSFSFGNNQILKSKTGSRKLGNTL
jgi:hypothetical protein